MSQTCAVSPFQPVQLLSKATESSILVFCHGDEVVDIEQLLSPPFQLGGVRYHL